MGAGKTRRISPVVALLFVLLILNLALNGCGLGGASTASSTPTTDPTTEPDVVAVPTSVDFGVTKVGTTKKIPLTLSNPGSKPLVVQSVAVTGTDFKITGLTTPLTINSGATLTAQVEYTPTISGTSTGTATVTTDKSNGNGKKIGLTGKGGTSKIDATPTTISFGTVAVGKTSSSSVTVTNSGTVSVTISSASVSNAAFALSGWNFPVTLAGGASQPLTVVYAPKASGSSSGTVSFTSDATSGAASLSLSGSAVISAPQVSFSPASIAFGNVNGGGSVSQPLSITNSGNADLTISAITASGAGFSVNGFTLPMTLGPGSSAGGSATFAPTGAGSVTGAVTVTSNAPTATASLSGTGIQGQLVATPTTVSFGSVNTGSSTTQTIALQNTGNANVTIQQANVTGAAFSVSGLTVPAVLTPGQSTSITARFAPTVGGAVTGSVQFATDAPTDPVVSFSGTGVVASPQVSFTPTSIAFGNVVVGNAATQSLTITNTGTANLNISQIAATGAAFSFSGVTVPLTLTPGQATTATVRFAPTTSGAATGSITVTSNATTATASLSGTGTQPVLSVSPTSIAFGSVGTGSTGVQALTLRNTGTAPLTVSAVAATGAGFSVSGFTLPLTINAGTGVAGSVTFAPTASGSVTGSVTVTSNSATAVAPVSLTGTGVAPAPQLAVSPTSIAFGNVNTGATATQPLTLSNTGTGTLTVSAVTPSGAGFAVTGFTLPMNIAAGASVAGSVTFSPTVGGSVTGSVSFTSNTTNAVSPVSLTATGVAPAPQLAVTPTSMTFGNVNTGASAMQALTLRNSGTGTLTVSAITPAGAGFSVTGFTLPLNIAAGASVAGSVTFAPTAGGSVTGSVNFTSNTTNAVAPVSLTGTGIAPAPQLALSPTSMSFGSVTTGQNSSQPLTIRNSGTADLHVTALTPAGAGFSVNGFILPLTLTPGTTAVGNVVFAPTTAGTVSGSVSVTSDSASAVPPVALSGTGVAATANISITPTTMAFGNVTTGQSATTPLMLSNTGTANLNITAITAAGAGYSVNGFILPLTLAPNANAVGNVVFAPTTSGTVNGTVTVTSNSAAAAPTVSMSGTGVAPQTFLLSVAPTSLSFGSILVGASSSLNVTLSNTGTGSVSVSAANVTGTGYSVGTTFPITIAAGATRAIAITFTPQLSGTANGSVAFVSNATNSPVTVTTSGTGQAPVQHSVDLTWAASTSTVSGYNIYRGTVSGGPYTLLNGLPVVSTSYTDSTVASGTTYYYVVRSVDGSGVESANSNQVTAVVPTP